MEAELKEQGKDIQKNLFIPAQNNLKMLETLCQTASTLEKEVKGERTEGQGETEEVLTELWKEMDKVVQLMTEGKAEEAEEVYRGSDAVVRFRMLFPGCLSEEERGNVQRQMDALRTELSERQREVSQTERYISRDTTILQDLLETVTRQVEDFESDLNGCDDTKEDKQEQGQEKTSEGDTENAGDTEDTEEDTEGDTDEDTEEEGEGGDSDDGEESGEDAEK